MAVRELIFSAALMIACTLVMICAHATSARADSFPATVTLPFYSGDGYATTFVQVNETDEPINDPNFVNPGCGSACAIPKILPRSARRTQAPPNAGIGVTERKTAIGLTDYSEIRTPHGAIARQGPLFTVDEARVYDLFLQGEYNGGLFVAAANATTVTLLETGEAASLSAGEGRILSAGSNPTVTLRSQLGGRFYVFGFVNHWRTGSIQIVRAR